MKHPSFHAVIVAAGSSSRMELELPKQYIDLAGKPVLQHSIDLFCEMDECLSVTIALHPDHQEFFKSKIIDKNISVVLGGDTRQESVHNALKSLSCEDNDIVLIHDAARPLVNEIDIKSLCLALMEEQAASLASPVRDTLRYADESGYACENVARENLWAIETPQGFNFGKLLGAHEKFSKQKDYSDDTKIISELGIPTKLVPTTGTNLKITFPHDLILAETLLSSKREK